MARFWYFCNKHGEFKVSLPKREKSALCPNCEQSSKALLGAGPARVVEVLDGGTQARSAEHLKDIEEIMHARERKFNPDFQE